MTFRTITRNIDKWMGKLEKEIENERERLILIDENINDKVREYNRRELECERMEKIKNNLSKILEV